MTGRFVRSLALCVAVAMFGAVTTARAEDEKTRRAKVHYQQGKAYYDAKAYDLAIEEYLAAYQLMPLPELHFNVAQAYRLMGDEKKALEYYRLYLEAAPNGRAAPEAREHVKVLTEKVIEEARKRPELLGPNGGNVDTGPGPARTEPAKTEPTKTEPAKTEPTETEPAKTSGETATDETGAGPRRVALAPQPDADLVKSAPAGGRGKGLRIAGLATAGVGLVAVGLGIKYGLDASSLSSELSDHTGPWTQDLLDKEAQGKSANTKFIVLTGVGAVAVIGGGVLYVLGRKQAADSAGSRALSLYPVVGPDGATVTLGGSF